MVEMLGEKRARESHPSRCEQFYASIIKVGHAIWRGWSAKGRVPLKAVPRLPESFAQGEEGSPSQGGDPALLSRPVVRAYVLPPRVQTSSSRLVRQLTLFFFFILTLPPRVRGTINGGLLLLSFSCSKDRCFLSFISFHLNPVIRFRVCA